MRRRCPRICGPGCLRLSARSVASRQAAERFATTALFFANGLSIGTWAVCIPLFRARLGLSYGALSVVLFAFAAGAVVSMPLAGLLGPRLGSGRAARIAGAGFALVLLLPLPALLAGKLVWLVAAATVVGGMNGAMDVSMNAHASVVERHRGRAIMSSFHAAFSGGGLAGAGLGVVLVGHGAGASAMLATAAGCVAALTAAAWPALDRGAAAVRVPRSARPLARSLARSLALPGRAALPLCAAALLSMLCEGAVGDWSAVYLATDLGAHRGLQAAGYAAFSATMVAGRLLGDRLVQALGRPGVVRGGAALAAAGLALACAAPGPAAAIGGFALVGAGLANVVPSLFSAAGMLGPTPAAGIAMAATAGYAGFLAGPPVIGAVADAAGLRLGIALLAAAAAGIAVLAAALRTRSGGAKSGGGAGPRV